MSAPIPPALDASASLPASLPKPPSFLRVMRILAGVALARFSNRMAVLNRKKPDPNASADGKTTRVATAPKRRRRYLAWLSTLFMFFSFLMLTTQLVERVSHLVDPASKGTPIAANDADKSETAKPEAADAKQTEIRFEGGRMWPNEGHDAAIVPVLGLVVSMLAVCLLLFGLCGNQDLGKVEWDLEWLFTLPVSARALFVSQAMPLTTFGFTGLLPLFVAAYCCSGYGAWGILLGVVSAAYVGLLIGFACLAGDIWLHKNLTPASRKNVQASVTLVASIMMFLYVMLVTSAGDWLLPYLMRLSEFAPWLVTWNPFGAPIALTSRWPHNVEGVVAMAGYAIVIPTMCVELSTHLVRHGLTSESGAYQGTHGRASRAGRRSWFGGIVGKELLLLGRDRNYMTQTLILPVIVFVFNIAMLGNLWTNATTNAQHGAALSFGLGVYLLMMSSSRVLASEGDTIWLFYTFPQQLHSMLLRKTRLWCVFALVYAIGSLAVIGSFGLANDPAFWREGATVVVGVIIYAFILSGAGVLGTEPNEHGVWRQPKELTYLNFILVALFVNAIYIPGIWGKIVQSVLCSALALAIWQRVQQQLPYLLDQNMASPPQVTLIDGLVAVLAFFTIQSIAMRLLALAELPPGKSMTIAFVIAGGVVVGTFLLLFRQRGVANLLETLRVKPAGERSRLLVRELAIAAVTGIVLGIIGAAYLWGVMRLDSIRQEIEATPLYSFSYASWDFWWLAALFVLAAPLFEEVIFRGIIHQSLCSTFRPTEAMLLSATLFAIVHPPISVAPVFLLGLAAAWSLNRSRFLGTSAVVHLVYNAVIVATTRLLL